MRQSALVLETLKRFLKHRGVTYQELARRLGQSESNVKRIFSQESISLQALDEMCEAVGIELLELARMSRPSEEKSDCFSQTQEKALAADPKLFALVYLLLSDATLKQVIAKFSYTPEECRKYLLALDRLGVVRLDAGDKFRMLISRNIRWIPRGPLNQLYEEEIKKEFFDSDFTKANERLRFLNGRLSKQSMQSLSRRLDRLIAEFVDAIELDQVGTTDDSVSLWMILAYRPWQFSVVDQYRRRK